jgi:choline monooxygenase
MLMNINKNIETAKTPPSSFYTSESIFEKSKVIFENSYQFICHKSEFNEASCYPFNLFENWIHTPLLITKEKDKMVCLSNVCTHRGNILCHKQDNKNKIVCNYHGRSFNLNGTVNHAPGFKKTKNFPSNDDSLDKNINLINWNGLLFVNTGQNKAILNGLNEINKLVSWYPFEKLSFDKTASNTYQIDAHWALYCENYLEGFHIAYVHKGLSSDIDNQSYETVLLEHAVLQMAKLKDKKDSLGETGKINGVPINEVYALYFWLFPNIMINFYKWGISVNIIEPLGKEKTRIRFISLPIKGSKQSSANNNSVDHIEFEDQKVVLSVQKGIKSKFYDRGRYSAEHEKGTHHFHQLISKYL